MSRKRRYITADEAITLLPEKEYIHTFIHTPPALVGADWERQDVIDKLKTADKIEIAGEQSRMMGHGLAVYNDDAKYLSDVLFIETDTEKLDAFDNPSEDLEELTSAYQQGYIDGVNQMVKELDKEEQT